MQTPSRACGVAAAHVGIAEPRGSKQGLDVCARVGDTQRLERGRRDLRADGARGAGLIEIEGPPELRMECGKARRRRCSTASMPIRRFREQREVTAFATRLTGGAQRGVMLLEQLERGTAHIDFLTATLAATGNSRQPVPVATRSRCTRNPSGTASSADSVSVRPRSWILRACTVPTSAGLCEIVTWCSTIWPTIRQRPQ